MKDILRQTKADVEALKAERSVDSSSNFGTTCITDSITLINSSSLFYFLVKYCIISEKN